MYQPLSYIHPGAKIAKNVVVEPFSSIDKNVVIGEGTWIGSNVTIMSGARIGKNVSIFPGSVISAVPQDLKFKGEDTTAVIGDNTTLRECVTINRGTSDRNKTKIGKNCLIMAYSHVAHDCLIGNDCVFANNVMLAGHVTVGNCAILGGLSAVHQWTRIGSYSFLGGFSALTKDLIPFGLAIGNRAVLEGLNLTGLRRRNFDKAEIKKIKEAYSILFDPKESEFKKRIVNLKNTKIQSDVVDDIIDFVSQKGNRSYCLPES